MIKGIAFACLAFLAYLSSYCQVQHQSERVVPQDCDNIDVKPPTIKPEFASFLAGVRNVVIAEKPKINGHIPAFNALYEYLKAMGFETVEYLDETHVSPKHLCEEVWVYLAFDYQVGEEFNNINLTWVCPCNGYLWTFTSNKRISDRLNSNPQYYFGQVFREMYGLTKAGFNSLFRLELKKLQSCWTEEKFRTFVQSNGCDKVEGIYEGSSGGQLSPKYRVAVKKISNTYHLIYLSGASNYGDWTEGEIKGTLESTATPLFYKCNWLMANKTENSNYYISFDEGIMNLITDKDKQIFIKLFPSASDIASKPSNIPASGTGFAFASNGYVATNYHVTEGAQSIKIRGVGGDFSKTYSAKIITEDKNNDLAILKIDDPQFKSFGNIPFVISNKSCDVGSSIFCLGYPLRATMGDEVKLTNGIISSKTGFQGDITAYQISAPVQPGNSGGPLFDERGNLIGIVNAKHLNAENVTYAIKASYLLNLIDVINFPPKLQTISLVNGKPLTDQVKILKIFTYIIEVN
jgi:S1-C subfamily serine protease